MTDNDTRPLHPWEAAFLAGCCAAMFVIWFGQLPILSGLFSGVAVGIVVYVVYSRRE